MSPFEALNATVTWPGFAAFWAITGDRLFDVFRPVLAGFYLAVISRHGWRSFATAPPSARRSVVLLGLVIILQREMNSFPRLLALACARQRRRSPPRDFVGWPRAKDGSAVARPFGDYATVSMLATLCLAAPLAAWLARRSHCGHSSHRLRCWRLCMRSALETAAGRRRLRHLRGRRARCSGTLKTPPRLSFLPPLYGPIHGSRLRSANVRS